MSRIAIPLNFLFKTTRLSENLTPKVFRADDNNNISVYNNKTDETIMNLSKNWTYVPNIRAIGKLIFLTPNAKNFFNHIRQPFIKASII